MSQIHREFRKPLIVMAPKNLLRHKECKSNLSEFDDVQGHPGFDKQGTRFKRLIKDQNDHSDLEEGIRRLVLCSGKVRFPHIHGRRHPFIYSSRLFERDFTFPVINFALHHKFDSICRSTTNLMKRGRKLMVKTLLYVEWNSFVHSRMTLYSVN